MNMFLHEIGNARIEWSDTPNSPKLHEGRYVDTYEEEEPVDIPATMQEIERIKRELAQTEAEIEKHLKELGFHGKG